jgi:hypothetical protein
VWHKKSALAIRRARKNSTRKAVQQASDGKGKKQNIPGRKRYSNLMSGYYPIAHTSQPAMKLTLRNIAYIKQISFHNNFIVLIHAYTIKILVF